MHAVHMYAVYTSTCTSGHRALAYHTEAVQFAIDLRHEWHAGADFTCPGLDNLWGSLSYLGCANGKPMKDCIGNSMPNCGAGSAACLAACTSC